MKDVIALDIGGTSVKCGLYDESGVLKKKWRVSTNTDGGGMSIFKDIHLSFQKEGIDVSALSGIGVGVPGPVKDGTVHGAVNLGWETVNVPEALKTELKSGVPVYVGNDANVAALGEFSKRGEKVDNMLLITLGTGVGGGIVLNGDIVEGAHGGAGEIGHMSMDPEGPLCSCGGYGCLETYSSATAVKRMANEGVKVNPDSSLATLSYIGGRDVFEHAYKGDALSEAIIDEAAEQLGRAIANVNTTLDLPLILIGGGLAQAGEYLLKKVRGAYQGACFGTSCQAEIKPASLGNDAGMVGAFELVMRRG